MSKWYWLYLVVLADAVFFSSFFFSSCNLATTSCAVKILPFLAWTSALRFFAFASAVSVGSLGLAVSTDSNCSL